MHAFESAFEILERFLGGSTADFGTRASAKALRDVRPELDAIFDDRIVQRLGIGVDDDEVDTLDLGVDHVGDGISACPANADHRDPGTKFVDGRRSDVDAHCRSPKRVSQSPVKALKKSALTCGTMGPRESKPD